MTKEIDDFIEFIAKTYKPEQVDKLLSCAQEAQIKKTEVQGDSEFVALLLKIKKLQNEM